MRTAMSGGPALYGFHDAPVIQSGWFHSAAFGIGAKDLLDDAASALARAERHSRRALESAEAPNVRLYSEAAHEDFLQSQAAVERSVAKMYEYSRLRPHQPASAAAPPAAALLACLAPAASGRGRGAPALVAYGKAAA